MSAYIAIRTDDAVHVFTDAASYFGDGTLGAVGQKVAVLAHLNAVISCRGPVGFLDGFAQAANTSYGSFDEMVESFALAVSNVYFIDRDAYAQCETGPEVEVFLAGWSESRDKPESYLVCSHEMYGPAWTMHELGPVVLAPYNPALGECLEAMEPGEDILAVGLAAMEAQRGLKGTHAGYGAAIAGVGGFCQYTRVSRQAVQTAVVRRWPDVVGERLGLAA